MKVTGSDVISTTGMQHLPLLRSFCVMMTSFLCPCRSVIGANPLSLLTSPVENMSGEAVPTELALVPSPPLWGMGGASCSSNSAMIWKIQWFRPCEYLRTIIF